MIKHNYRIFFDIVKHPIITDKSTRLIENNQYSFAVSLATTKSIIKEAIEHIFNVQVSAVNTMRLPIKRRRVRNIIGKKPRYKKAIVTLSSQETINLLPK